jgi:hypothetical protein
MIVYGLNRLPLAQESNEELALPTQAQAALEAAATAVPAHVRAEGSGEVDADADLAMQPLDDDDNPPLIKK